jgi:hypothetical protein
MWKSGNVDGVIDTTSRKAYSHPPLISQEQPLSMRISCDLFKKLPFIVSLPNLKFQPLLDDRLIAILKLDIGIYNVGIKVSKCILVNLLESLSCDNNSFKSKSTLWMISNTLLAIAPSIVYTWISNEVTHCVNSSVTWWPQNFNHVNFFKSPHSTVCPFVVSKAIRLLTTLVLLCSCHSWINCLPKLNSLCFWFYLDVFHVC